MLMFVCILPVLKYVRDNAFDFHLNVCSLLMLYLLIVDKTRLSFCLVLALYSRTLRVGNSRESSSDETLDQFVGSRVSMGDGAGSLLVTRLLRPQHGESGAVPGSSEACTQQRSRRGSRTAFSAAGRSETSAGQQLYGRWTDGQATTR